MAETIKVLLVEDEQIDQMAFTRFVKREGLPFETVIAGSVPEARGILERQAFDVILVDYFLGNDTAFDLLEVVKDIPCIVITGLGDEEVAVKAMKLGASDYLAKDSSGNYLKTLPTVVANAIRLKRAETQLDQYRKNLEKMVVERTEELSAANLLLRQEIEERKQAEATVLLQASALESAVNGILITDLAGRILWANSALVKMTGYSLEEMIANQPDLFQQNQQGFRSFIELWNSIKSGQSWYAELPTFRKNGSSYMAEMSVTPVTDDKGRITHFISICQDISEKIQTRERLEYLATHDALTGLPNRILFGDRLAHALALAKRTSGQGAILLVDLDDFKAINDAFSHDVGDDFLKAIADRFNQYFRESDTIARIGGDEFAVLIEDIDQMNIEAITSKMNQVLSEPIELQGRNIVSTASIGISVFPQDGDSVQTLLKNADLAMYQAKERKNSFQFYNRDMTDRAEKQMELTNYLRYALQNNIFQLHYQPQVDAVTGRIIGLEALIRLPHPQNGWIAPNDFIPLAEKTGLITLIDEWVLRVACKKMKGLLEAGFHKITMSVNISGRQLGQLNLFPILDAVLKEHGLNPGNLELEISENSVFQNINNATTTLTKLKAMGVKLAIDDFGIGFASLNYLSNFPLDTLKIDVSFTNKVLSSKSDAAIVAGVISIANSLGLGIVVEGVEKIEQLEFFSNLGCRVAQGYFFSPAVAEGEINNLLRAGFARK